LWPGILGSFIFDDYPIFVDNPVVHVTSFNTHDWAAVLYWAQHNVQRPLAMLSYSLNYAFGAGPMGFKLTNLVLHLINVMLVAALATRMIAAGPSPRPDDDAAAHQHRSTVWGWTLAMAWGLHPLQVSTVMYVVQRMEVIGFTFSLLALLSYWTARQRQIEGERGLPWLLLAGLCMVIGYFAKETVVLVAGYAFLMEWTLLHFQAKSAAVDKAWRISYVAAGTAAVAVFLFYLVPHFTSPAAYQSRDFTAWERELTQLRVLPLYLEWSVLPLPTQMHFYYDNFAASRSLLEPATTLAGGLFLLTLLGLAIGMRKRRPLFALGVLWFFVAHAITSSPIPLELVFEHRNYPALFGVLLAVTDLVWAATSKAHPRLPTILAVIFLTSLGFLTILRAATWGKPLQLELTLVENNPGSPRARYDLARRYMTLANGDAASPLFRKAINQLEKAAALPGASPLAEQALLITAADYGFQADPAWWASLQDKLKTRPLGPEAFLALNGLNRKAINDQAPIDATQLMKAYAIVTERRPEITGLHVQYADVASILGHKQALAVSQLTLALKNERASQHYPLKLMAYLLDNQRSDEAKALIEPIERLFPMIASSTQWRQLRARAERPVGPDPAAAGTVPAN
jgi:hypothetical protein